jgi:WD40 repeat protein
MKIKMGGRRWFTLVPLCVFLTCPIAEAAEPTRLGDLRGIVQAHFNHDGSRVVLRTGSEQFGIWDARNGTPIAGDAALKKPSEGYVMSPDGRKVLVGFKDRHARVFDTSSGAAISPMLDLSIPESDNPRAVFSPDGGTLVFFGEKETSVFEVKTGRKIANIPVPFEVGEGSGSTASAIFTKDGAKCFVSDSGATVTVHETKKWTALGKPMSHPPAEKAYSYGFDASSDGKWVVTFDDPGENGPKGNLQVWDATTSKPLDEPLVGDNGMSGRFLPGQNRVLVGPGRGDATVRDLPTMAVSYEVKKHDELDGPNTDVFPNGKWFLAWGPDKKMDLIDAATGKILSSYSFPVQAIKVKIAPDSAACYLGWQNEATDSEDGNYNSIVQRLSVPDLKTTGSASIPDFLFGQATSPDGRYIMILQGSEDDVRIALFDAATMKPIE